MASTKSFTLFFEYLQNEVVQHKEKRGEIGIRMFRIPLRRHRGWGSNGSQGWGKAALFAIVYFIIVIVLYYTYQKTYLDTYIYPGENQARGPQAHRVSQQLKEHVRLDQADAETLHSELSSIVALLLPRARSLIDRSTEVSLDLEIFSDTANLPPNPLISRLSDEHFGPNPAGNIPGVQDVHAEIDQYTKRMIEKSFLPLDAFKEAKKRQQRLLSADLGLSVQDTMDELDSIPQRIEFINFVSHKAMNKIFVPGGHVAITTTTSVDLRGVRTEIIPWIQYHVDLGVGRFYIAYDGHDSAAVDMLQKINVIRLIHLHSPWASPIEVSLWESQLYLMNQLKKDKAQGNYLLMAKQQFCIEEAVRRCREEGTIDWLIHLDSDELIYPGSHQEFSISHMLARLPHTIPAIRFLNFEGQPEVGDVQNRFEQVTLFRAHKHFITPEAFWYRNKVKQGENDAFLYLYANGKSAVRVGGRAGEGVHQSGPHYFVGPDSERWATADNPTGKWMNYVSDNTVVLHYAYSSPGEVSAKARRSCPDLNETKISNGTDSKKSACFVIDFDMDAYMAALEGEESVLDFFYSRMVLSEGTQVKCSRPVTSGDEGKQDRREEEGWCSLTDIPRYIHLMEKIGLMKRILAPQMLMRQHERMFQWWRDASNSGLSPRHRHDPDP